MCRICFKNIEDEIRLLSYGTSEVLYFHIGCLMKIFRELEDIDVDCLELEKGKVLKILR